MAQRVFHDAPEYRGRNLAAVSFAERGVPAAKMLAQWTATQWDDERVKDVEAGLFVMRRLLADPVIDATIRERLAEGTDLHAEIVAKVA